MCVCVCRLLEHSKLLFDVKGKYALVWHNFHLWLIV